MSERSDPFALPQTAELRCGDCRSVLRRPPVRPVASAGSPSTPAPEPDPETQPGEYYCPACATPERWPLDCPYCGSLICSRCGTPVESADDLGIG